MKITFSFDRNIAYIIMLFFFKSEVLCIAPVSGAPIKTRTARATNHHHRRSSTCIISYYYIYIYIIYVRTRARSRSHFANYLVKKQLSKKIYFIPWTTNTRKIKPHNIIHINTYRTIL